MKVEKIRKGMVQIYTGNGKGKTTAALGLAFRALGQGMRVLLIQFMKKGRNSGELKAAQRFSKFEILQTGRASWVSRNALDSKDREAAQRGWLYAKEALKNKKYDLVILDELNVAVDFGLLQPKEVKDALRSKAQAVEVVITGRVAHPEIIRIADLVSEIRELKHYYRRGIMARAGVEY